MTYYIPEVGEKVAVNGGLIAEITNVNVEGNLVTFVTGSERAGFTHHTEHLSHTRLEPLTPKPVQPELPLDEGKATDKGK